MTVLELVRVEPPAPAPSRRRNGRAGRGTRRQRLTVTLVLAALAVLHAVNLAGWPRWFDDEGTYYSQAWAVQHLGALAPYTYWYDHPPAGWLQLAALTWLPDLLIPGESSLLSGRIVMVGYLLASAGLLYVLARRLGMRHGFALGAMVLWAANPLVLFEGRQIFLDNVALPWLLLAFVLALNRRRHLGLHMAAGGAFAVAVLTKETTAVFAVPLLVALWQGAYRPTRAFTLVGFGAVLSMTGALYLLFALIRGELLPGPGHVSLWDALSFQFADRAPSGSIFDPNGPAGGAYVTFHSWLAHDGFLLLGGVAAGVVALLVRRLRPAGVAVVVCALVGLRPSGYLPQMYVVALLPFCALCLVGLFDHLWRRVRSAPRGRLVAAAALVALTGLAVSFVPVGGWQRAYAQALTEDANDPQYAMADQLAALPPGATIAVDNTYWNDLVEAGRSREDVVWFFKVDHDAAVPRALGDTYEGLDYLVWTQYMADNAGPIVEQAYASSVLVATTGEYGRKVELRRVLDVREVTARREAAAAAVARQVAEARADFDAYLARPSPALPQLTNGQVEAIRTDARQLGLAAVARKYGISRATIEAALRIEPAPDRADALDAR